MGVIRFLLALVVAGDHFSVINLQRAGLTNDGIQQWIVMNAGFAVMFFYVISGFLISYTLSNKYSNDWLGTTRFYRSRAIRIFSLYWPLLLISFIVYGNYGIQWTMANVFTNIFILGGDWLRAFSAYPSENNTFHPLLGQVWSVGAELTFYLLAPFVLRSLKATTLLLVFSLIIRLTLEYKFNFHQAWDYHFFPSALWFFLIGHLARKIYDFGLTKSGSVSALLLISSMVLLTGTRVGGIVSPWFYFSIICFALALPGIFESTKNIKWMNFLGDLSYPIYLIHIWVLWQFAPIGSIDLISIAKEGAPLPIVVFVYLATLFLISIAVHYLIEHPCVVGLNRLFDFSKKHFSILNTKLMGRT